MATSLMSNPQAAAPPTHGEPVHITNATTRAQQPMTQVVPEEDTEHNIEVLDDEVCENDDEYDEFLTDGAGGDSEDGDEEENEDLREFRDDGSQVNAGTPSAKRRPLPGWLKDAFEQKLDDSRLRGDDKLPALYRDHKTFWFPTTSPFFRLRTTAPKPQDLFTPLFFLWDPLPLCPVGIPCPKCNTSLRRHCEINRPRRCVDINQTFWLIGYRYRCPNCVNPISGKKSVTFRSWDERILNKLPRELAVEFPALMSHRSAITKTFFSWMRSSLQCGMGPKQVSNALRVQHLEQHDVRQLQYLSSMAARRNMDMWLGMSFTPFPAFDDSSDAGFHGFIPTSGWLRDIYDKFIEGHGSEFNQHMSMLTGRVCAFDHSHKVCTCLGIQMNIF